MSERKIIKELHLDEVSFVDRPAQEGALAAIMKAKSVSVGDMVSWNSSGGTARGKVERVIAEGEIDVPGSSFEIEADEDDPAALIRIYRDGEPTDTLVGHKVSTLRKSQEDTDVEKAISETIGEIAASKTAGDHPVSTEVSMSDKPDQVAELETKLADLQKSLDAEKSAREQAETVAKMSDAEKAYMDGMDDEGKAKFRKMSPEDRAKAMKVAKASDESVTVEGETVYKSAVGEATFALYKRLEAVEKAAAADREAAQMTRLEKRAGDEFANLPGKPADLAKALGAIEGLDASVRETIEGVFKASEAQFATLTKSIGHGNGQVNKGADAKLEAAAADIRKANPSLTKEQAIAKALDANPELYEG